MAGPFRPANTACRHTGPGQRQHGVQTWTSRPAGLTPRALSAATGVEALVGLLDVAGASRAEARETVKATARMLDGHLGPGSAEPGPTGKEALSTAD